MEQIGSRSDPALCQALIRVQIDGKGYHNMTFICNQIRFWFLGGTSFVDLLCFCSVLCLLCLCARLFICALWSPAGKGLTSWLSFVVSNCEFVTFPLVSWVGCGT